MELLSVGFAILLIKVAISFMPGVLGIYCIASPEESKRKLRSFVCAKLFGISNAIEYKKFARFMATCGVFFLLFSAVATWFLLIYPMVSEG